MMTLITLLISLLGYGSPEDFQDLTETELNNQIEMASTTTDGGVMGGWDSE